MKVSYDWLKTMVELPEDPSELAREFIRTGTEVESIDTVGEAYHLSLIHISEPTRRS